LAKLIFNREKGTSNRFFFLLTFISVLSHKHFLRKGDAQQTEKKSAKLDSFNIQAAYSVRITCSGEEHSLCQYIGAAIIPVFDFFSCFSSSSCFGLESFLLSGYCSFPVIVAIIQSFQSLKSKEIKRGEVQQTLAVHCLM
jgi:hypothetical protein